MPKDADLAFNAALFEKAESLYTLILNFFSCFCVSTLAYTKGRCVFVFYMLSLDLTIYKNEYKRGRERNVSLCFIIGIYISECKRPCF